MSQLAQLSEAEIEDRFYVVGARPVQFMLAGFAEQAVPFTVQFGGGQEHFLTTLLAAEPDSGKLIFDCSGSNEVNHRFLDTEQAVFVGRPGGIHVQFTSGAPMDTRFEGGRAFAVALPKKVLRLQRREFFRIDTPRNRAPQFFARLPGGGLLPAQTHNISCGGIGLLAGGIPSSLVPGLALGNCRLVLPDDPQDIFLDATVRHLTEQESRAGSAQWRVGLEFRDLDLASENRIQRYIARIEHERRELA